MSEAAQIPDAKEEANDPPRVHLLVRLELPDKPVREFSYDFKQSLISIGRDSSNDIQIPLTTVSREHARIFYEMGDYFLEDLGSTHGTMRNGTRVQRGEKKLLRDGDQIEILSFQVTFRTTATAMLDRQPGEKTEALARRMVQEVLSSLGGPRMEPPALRVMNGAEEGRRLELRDDQPEVTIGRSPECDFALDDPNISRRHCLIKRNWHGFTAQDLGSKNGVLLNGEQADRPIMMKDGDEIQIGGVKLIFIDPPSRLLQQMGGLTDDTAQPETAGDPGEDDAGSEYEDGEPEDAPPDSEYAAEPKDEPPAPVDDVDIPPPRVQLNPALSMPPPELEAMSKEFAAVQKKGVHWDLIILIFGTLFLGGAVALIVFLVS